MASRPPRSAAGRVNTPGLFLKPMWEPWGGADEVLSDDGKQIVGVGDPKGRVRLVAADTTHTALVKSKMDPQGRPQSAVKGFVPLEYAPDDAKIMWFQMRERMIAASKAVGIEYEDLIRQRPHVAAFAHFAEQGKKLLAERAKAGKGAVAA